MCRFINICSKYIPSLLSVIWLPEDGDALDLLFSVQIIAMMTRSSVRITGYVAYLD